MVWVVVLALACCSGLLLWLVALACRSGLSLWLVALACRSGLSLWLVALACRSGLSLWLGIHAFFRSQSLALRATFENPKSSQKGSFAANLPFGLPAAILKITSATGTRKAHVLVRTALYAPSMALQPVAEVILKTD